jgi:mannosyl-glycoprotein endo-beta-N-acetylglucosaminidase
MAVSAAALVTALSPVVAVAKTTSFPMRQTRIELNSGALSAPFGFTDQNTTYIPLFYVQQLLNKLQIRNRWDGSTWHITTPFGSQPSFVLKTARGSMGIVVNGKSFATHVDKVVTLDPSSKHNTTFIPIWYIMQTLQSIGLHSTWDGITWNVKAAYTDVTKSGVALGLVTTLTDAEAALLDYPGGLVKDNLGHIVFTEPSFMNVDLRYSAPQSVNASSLNQYLSNHHSIMAGLGQTFMDAQARYGVDATYLVSHAMEETGSNENGSGIAIEKNNLYGYGAFDANASSDAGTFPSEAYAILFQAWEVRNNYLNPTASHYVTPTLTGMSVNYASDPQWTVKINDLMDQLAIDMNDNVSRYTQYSPNNQPPIPSGGQNIPVYSLKGAIGTVNADPYYATNIPAYADGGAGHQHMFVRALQLGDQGDDVQTLQQALNLADKESLTTDGIFGPSTQAAVKTYQSAHGLTATGICDFTLWNSGLNLSGAIGTVTAGQSISIDAIVEGMAGGQVTQWYDVPNVGWVNASDVTLTNVYRLTEPNPHSTDVSIPVSNQAGQVIASLHAGDYVVCENSEASGSRIPIQFATQDTGTELTGFINPAQATLTQVSH